METILTNAAAARLVRKDGRDWRVAGMTIIVPGVLAGSKGALFYPPDECRNSVPEWDAVPITCYHPTDAAGFPVSAAHPNAKQIGHLRNTRFDGKLRTEGWFDVEKTRAVDKALGTNVLWSLEHGHAVELSTGLYTENTPSNGVHKGRSYDYVAKNYRADHLAVLPNGQVGACSLNDGCGVLVNRVTQNVWSDAARAAALAARQASHEAHDASFNTGHEKATRQAGKAAAMADEAHSRAENSHDNIGYHTEAATLHEKLGAVHEKAQRAESRAGDAESAGYSGEASSKHYRAAHHHRDAVSLYTANKKQGCGDGG